MQRWEYFVAPLLEHNPGEILNTFGEDGWELVSVAQIENPMGGKSLVAYMKRPKALVLRDVASQPATGDEAGGQSGREHDPRHDRDRRVPAAARVAGGSDGGRRLGLRP